jgi:hypothetical protein
VIKLEDGTEMEPKDEHEVVCEVHGFKTTWGKLDPFQQLAVESGLDTTPDSPCLLKK